MKVQNWLLNIWIISLSSLSIITAACSSSSTPPPMLTNLSDFPVYPGAEPYYPPSDLAARMAYEVWSAFWSDVGVHEDDMAFYWTPRGTKSEDVEDFYENEMSKLGWERIEDESSLDWKREGLQLRVKLIENVPISAPGPQLNLVLLGKEEK